MRGLMFYSIPELLSKWQKEKQFYKSQEVGSGVQKFVKDVLICPDLFGLKEGKLSTPLVKRKSEFLEEYFTKEGRKVDIAIFISPEIVIPIEVEQYTFIDRGLKQLFQYQADLDQKYGILTDGYTWRFFNNNVYRSFNISQIFSNKDLFIDFWNDYTLTEKYYLSYFEPQGQISLFREIEILDVEENIEIFFQDITKLIRSFSNKLQLEGYIEGNLEKAREKKAIQITYAYIIQFILYKTLVDNDFGTYKADYKTYLEYIHKHIKDKTFKYVLTLLDKISSDISKNIYRPFSGEQKFISKKLGDLLHSIDNDISDVAPWLDLFIFIKKYNFSNIQNDIFGYIYENYLKDLYEEEKKGQYFTDPKVVNFMINQIGYTASNIKKLYKEGKIDNLSIIDPSAGSGTFLYSAVDHIVNSFFPNTENNAKVMEQIVTNNIFGLDIEEFPLYLAEMNVLMRMLPYIITEKYNIPIEKKIKVFLTKDSIAEFIGTGIESGAQFELGRQEPEFDSFLRDKDDLKEMKNSLEKQGCIPRRRFDYVIGNPPYIPYNECSKQKMLLFEWIKEKRVKLNNIYGVNLHSTPGNPKKYRPNPNLYTFFIALGLALLKKGGKLCYIVPQTILVNSDFDVIRYHLSKFTKIEKIITFNSKMFIGRGIRQNKPVPTSSLILIAANLPIDQSTKVEIINYKKEDETIENTLQNILDDINVEHKVIAQKELLENIANWNFIKFDDTFSSFYKEYKSRTQAISVYSEHKYSELNFKSKFYFDGGYGIDEKKFLDKPIEGMKNYKAPKLDDKFMSIKSFLGYWPDIKDDPKNDMFIKLRQGNQAYYFLDTKYKVIWSYNNTTKFFFSDEPIIWARNKYLGIGSDYKEELLYLFSLLNSGVTETILSHIIKIQHEETRTILVSLQTIKDIIRVPIIKENNISIKKEIIELTELMLSLDDIRLSDFVDFSAVGVQKFSGIGVKGNFLILKYNNKEIKLNIQNKTKMVADNINKHFRTSGLDLEKEIITLSRIINTQVIDSEKQLQIKSYVDDLIFALFLGIPVTKVGIQHALAIKQMCKENQYYCLLGS